jgi:molybdate transport system substrate-binding protein
MRRRTVLGGAWLALPVRAQPATLVVAVDSSLATAMAAVARTFEAGRGGLRVQLLTGAVGSLLEQIAQGTRADVLAGSDAETAGLGLQRRLLSPGLGSVFAGNALVLVVPAGLAVPVQRLADLARPELARIAIGRVNTVAVGRYAREAINAQRLWPQLQRKVVPTEDVREALDLVARAEVEAGLVYATDARAAGPRVRVVETLATATPIRYVANVTARSTQAALAHAFIEHLRGDAAQALFRRDGFGPP